MGIDYDGGMIVGCDVDDLSYDEEKYECIWDYADEHNMAVYSKWYDADSSGQFVGFTIPNTTPTDEDFPKWVEDVVALSKKFEEITGEQAQLVGMQDIW